MATKTKLNAATRRATAVIFLLTALLLTLLGAALGLGNAYRVALTVDTSQLSPTLLGADLRTDLRLQEQLDALSMDEEISLASLFDEGSAVSARLQGGERLYETAKEMIDYLRSFDASLANDWDAFSGSWRAAQIVRSGKIALLALAGTLLAAVILAAVCVFAGRPLGGCVLGGFAALLTGGLPLGLLLAVERSAAGFDSALASAARYGIGFRLSVSLTATGKAEVYLGAAALAVVAAALFLLPAARRRKSPAR